MFLRKIFIGSLTSIVYGSKHSKYVFLSYHKCKNQPTLIWSHRNEYTQRLRYDLFPVNLDIYFVRYNTLYDRSNKVCIPNKREDLNLSVFNLSVFKM